MRRPAAAALIALFAGLLAAGCGSDGSSKAADAAPPAASPSGATAPAPKKTLTAEQVANALKKHGLPVRKITVFDEKSDPNKKLGRPGQYTSKVTFVDARVKNGQPNDISSGGSVEVFEEADALTRGEYIQTTIRAMPVVGAEYDYLSGGVLLRVAGELPPSAAKAYRAALEDIAGGPIVTPKPSHT
jgi:hypothetical protein